MPRLDQKRRYFELTTRLHCKSTEKATSKPKIRHLRCIKQGAILTGHCCISGSLSPWIDPGRRHCIVRPLLKAAMSMNLQMRFHPTHPCHTFLVRRFHNTLIYFVAYHPLPQTNCGKHRVHCVRSIRASQKSPGAFGVVAVCIWAALWEACLIQQLTSKPRP